MIGMNWDGTCNFMQAMPRYLHHIQRRHILVSVPCKVGGRNAQFCVCASLVCTELTLHACANFAYTFLQQSKTCSFTWITNWGTSYSCVIDFCQTALQNIFCMFYIDQMIISKLYMTSNICHARKHLVRASQSSLQLTRGSRYWSVW